ncbi:hypothetical protein PRIPAC_72761 [Pristionchus pacificus]|uniref:Na/H antiporter n=1 Tax=Pristionchus pacificus TaxID=54126 RepID=A0A2A6CFU0_PRIPA|nr:hypothetical protein PRIPAC_72761 [Pristionchus pacificus]|eukprot:PDM77072.1 Na/H antiporter [Pristionchus pacificus]
MVDSSSLHYFYFPCVAVILALIVDAVKKKTSFPLPESVLLFLIAVAGSFFLHIFLNQQERETIRKEYLWLDMQPDAILGILLPPLLFESAYKVNMSFFLFRIKMIITLTGAIYILTAALVAAVYVPIFNIISGWHHFVSCILASILVATDPVAVVSILESMGAPLRLRILIEGERLLNDGLAIFTFKFFLRLFEQFSIALLSVTFAAFRVIEYLSSTILDIQETEDLALYSQFIHIVSALLFVISILSRNTPITVLTILTLVYLYHYSFMIPIINNSCPYCRSARVFSPSSTTSIAYALLRRFPLRGEPSIPTHSLDSFQHQRLH